MCGYSVSQANEIEILGWTLALVRHIFVPNQRHFKFITNLVCLVGEEVLFCLFSLFLKNPIVTAKFLLLALAENVL